MPGISDILDSVRVPALIKDGFIRNGRFETSSKGLIRIVGGFTVVFPVEVSGAKWAFRCWHTEMGNVRRRFQIISDYINTLASPYFCDFFYCDEGLVVDGKIYPTTRMRWVEGLPINEYIKRNVGDSEALKKLADSFVAMIEFLHEKRIAHGDLQHGNIIVNDGDIKLVDYDSMFVPGLDGYPDIIIGKGDFQHPRRKDLHISSAKLDYFSELVIYLSILALSKKPSLIDDFSIDDSLLFRSSDWENFRNTKIYQALNDICDDDVRLLLRILEDYLAEDNIDNLIPFTEQWRKRVLMPVIKTFSCGRVDGLVYRNVESTILWDVENVSAVYVDGEKMAPGQQSVSRKFSKDTDIVIRAQNGLHTVEQRKHIQVLELPVITITADKEKLKRSIGVVESAVLSWNVNNAHSVSLKCGEKKLSTKKAATGFRITPKSDSTYDIVVVGLDRETEFRESIDILVRDAAEIELTSDKMFTLPGVPVTISWNAKHVKSAKLNGTNVPCKGTTVVTPNSDEEYTLLVENEFGEASEKIKVRILPLPVVKSVLVDTPKIDRTVSIYYSSPHFEALPELPVIETDFAKLDVPSIPDIKSSGLFVELPTIPKLKLSQRISRFIKNIIK